MSASVQTSYIRDDAGIFHCPYCDKKTEKQNTMYYHVKKNHLQDYKYVCNLCEGESRKFVQRSAYLQHMANSHPDDAISEGTENPYVGVSFGCPCCDHSAKTKANVIIHYARTHCKEWIPSFTKGIHCKGCEKEFGSSTAYLYHSVSCIKPMPEDCEKHLAAIAKSTPSS